MQRAVRADLPAFAFPIVAWAPDPASGTPTDDATRCFLTPSDVTRTYFPEDDTRHGWTFVDTNGRCWEAVSARVAGLASPWWARGLPRWLYSQRYRLEFEFAERPPMTFDRVGARLRAAVNSNPEFYRGWKRQRLEQIRAAESLRDLIKSEEELAIERLEPMPLWRQWLLWEGRCSRLTFFPAIGTSLTTGWLAITWLGPVTPAFAIVLPSSLLLGISALVRRLHDLRRTGWWLAAWLFWTQLCAVAHDATDNPIARLVSASVWQLSTLCLLGFLLVWPGTRGPNRFGWGKAQRRIGREARAVGGCHGDDLY